MWTWHFDNRADKGLTPSTNNITDKLSLWNMPVDSLILLVAINVVLVVVRENCVDHVAASLSVAFIMAAGSCVR